MAHYDPANILAHHRRALPHWERIAESAAAVGDMELHVRAGEKYHRCAEEILRISGFDPRPQE